MTVPRTRRTANTPDGKTKDVNPATKIVIEEDTKGLITEHQEGRTIQYEAKLEQDEETQTEDETFDFDDENSSSYQDQTAYQEFPKDPLTVMFDGVREAQNQEGETFIANILRLQDFMNDNFNVPCSMNTPFPPLQFTARDVFTFVATLQKSNNNSGGRFMVRVYRQDGNPVRVYVGRNGAHVPMDLGIPMLPIPNPTKEAIAMDNNNGQGNAQIAQLIAAVHESNQQFQRTIIEAINKPKEKSEIESLVMSLAVQKMMNPEAPVSNNLEQTMATLLLAPQMIEGMSRKMFPEPTPEREPDMLDKIERVMQVPMVQNVANGLAEIGKNFAINKMSQQANTVQQNAPQTEPPIEQPIPQELTQAESDMQELIELVLDELNGEFPLDASNQTIIRLSKDYPDQFSAIKMACNGMEFDNVLNMLIQYAGKVEPNPFIEYIDVAASQTAGSYVWTAEGETLKARLKELYDYLKT